jgi:hemoglobin
VLKKDIQERKDIEVMVNLFYEKIKQDDLIGYIFNDLVKVDWDKHLPVMYDFWEGVIFFTGSYTGNPMITHRKLNHVVSLTPEHFNRWLKLFLATVDENFEGEKAELAKQRALSIATVMQLKLST